MMRFLVLGLLAFAAVHTAEGCTIPVFRFALDRWEADKFHLVLPASAAKDTAIQDILRPLRANGKANLDITTSKDAAQTLAELHSSREGGAPVWSGTLDKGALEAVLDSAARQQILAHILAGDSIQWVIADSGSPLDTAEAERIEKRLKFLEQVAALPIQDPNDPDSQLGPGPPLRLKFTTLRLRRDDPAEKVLLQMLAGPKGEIEPATTSFAAVVFGKGRVLGAWPLALLDDRSLEETSMFLVGRCSCRLKVENPGWDLLLNVDWEKALEEAGRTQAKTASVAAPDPAPKLSKAERLPHPASAAKLPALEVVSIQPQPVVPGAPSRPNTLWIIIGTAALAGVAWWGFTLRK